LSIGHRGALGMTACFKHETALETTEKLPKIKTSHSLSILLTEVTFTTTATVTDVKIIV
jgi:hypothetical protein